MQMLSVHRLIRPRKRIRCIASDVFYQATAGLGEELEHPPGLCKGRGLDGTCLTWGSPGSPPPSTHLPWIGGSPPRPAGMILPSLGADWQAEAVLSRLAHKPSALQRLGCLAGFESGSASPTQPAATASSVLRLRLGRGCKQAVGFSSTLLGWVFPSWPPRHTQTQPRCSQSALEKGSTAPRGLSRLCLPGDPSILAPGGGGRPPFSNVSAGSRAPTSGFTAPPSPPPSQALSSLPGG